MILPDSRNCDCRTGENAELESRERRGTSSWDKLNNLELAVNLPKRGNLPGAENLVAQHFLELFAQSKNNEVAELAVESPQGILCTPDTVDKFQVSTKSASVKTVLHTVATTIVGPSAIVMTAIVCPSDIVAVVMMYKRGKGSVTFGCLFYMLGSPGRGSGQPRKEEREMQALLLVVQSLPFISATTVLEGQSDVLEQYLKDSRTTVSRL